MVIDLAYCIVDGGAQCRERITGGRRYCALVAEVFQRLRLLAPARIVSRFSGQDGLHSRSIISCWQTFEATEGLYDIRDNGLVASIVNQETFQMLL